MALSGISSTTGGTSTLASRAATGAGGELGRDAFLRLLTEQLRHQNPLEPSTGTEFIGQLATFSTLESLEKMNTGLGNLFLLQQVSLGADLIGKEVTFLNPNTGTQDQGKVQGVSFQGGQLQLNVDGQNVGLEQVKVIAAA